MKKASSSPAKKPSGYLPATSMTIYRRCACNSDVNCDPSKLNSDSAAQPCQYLTVVAEYTVNGTTSSRASVILNASPVEVRRIFTMGLPSMSHHAGQILFGPNDGYLYFTMGDGGAGDPYNFAQNKKSLLGKIMRFDVDNIPSEEDITCLGLWGNYSIPRDNPYIEDKDLQPEIWALGFSNPWRCSFDAKRPSYFMCADVGQNDYEEVDVITKNGNYIHVLYFLRNGCYWSYTISINGCCRVFCSLLVMEPFFWFSSPQTGKHQVSG